MSWLPWDSVHCQALMVSKVGGVAVSLPFVILLVCVALVGITVLVPKPNQTVIVFVAITLRSTFDEGTDIKPLWYVLQFLSRGPILLYLEEANPF